MTRLLEWLLDLEKVGLRGGEPVSLEWGRAVPPWLVVGLALIAIALVAFIYRRERASLPRVAVLSALRLALVFLVGVVLCKPMVVWKRVRTEASSIVLLVDHSQSMASHDAYLEADGGAGLNASEDAQDKSRLDRVREALVHDDGRPLRALLDRHRVQLATFSNSLTEMPAVGQKGQAGEIIDALGEVVADGPVTDLPGAISGTIEKWAGSRLAGIVLASDGQTTTNHDLRPALELAARRGVPIYPIRIGSGVAPIDVEVSPPRAASTVLANDVVTVEATLTSRGLTEGTPIEVKLVDVGPVGEEVLATQTVVLSPDGEEGRVELKTTPTRAGLHEFRVQAAAAPSERITANNADIVHVRVIDDRVRVLYVEGYPRYEYRYLKNALVRERTVDLSVLLLEADERFVQEGTNPIRRFPDTPEELNRYDVVIFGDVDPKAGWLTQAQMIMLLDFVANQGGGFAVIAGERAAPRRFFATPLDKLLPVVDGPRVTGAPGLGLQLELTPEGKANRVLRFATDRNVNEELVRNLPQIYWSMSSVEAKPGATVLAETSKVDGGGSDRTPLIVAGQYGGGKLFFQATDDTWRWRRHTGEFLHDSYWVQVVRYLMPTARLTGETTLAIRTDRRVYGYGDPVHVDVQVADPMLPANQREMKLVVERSGTGESGDDSVGKAAAPAMLAAVRVSVDPDRFEASFVPPTPGSFTIRAAEAPSREKKEASSAAIVRVNAPDLESRRPAANHQALQMIAAGTGGQVVPLDRLEETFGAIPDRSLIIPDDVEESLWDSKLVLSLFVLIAGCEWVLRKVFGLL